jgi:hypothetical protein
MSERVEKHRARKRKLEEIRNMRRQNFVAEMTSKVRVADEQKTTGECINNTDYYCDESTSDYSDDNDINDSSDSVENCHDSKG